MNRFQQTLIEMKSFLDKSGILNFRFSQILYWYIYRFYKRQYEGRSLHRVIRYLAHNPTSHEKFKVILDVGAHIGSSTDLMIEYFPQSRIIAFEPDPRNTEWFGNFLSQQITKGSVELIKKAIWSSSGEIPFTFQASNTADNKFDPGSDIKVPSISIDDYALRTGIKIDLMKIDVQGFEWEVIKGSLVTLQQQRPSLILELDLEALNARGGSENELFDLLGELNYSVINPIDGKTLNRSKVRDLIAVERCIDLLLVPLSDKVTEKS